MSDASEEPTLARYVFAVRFRLDPEPCVHVDPETFETTASREADLPGDPGWLFFRDNCWRGELADPSHFSTLAEDALGVPVEAASFRELRTTEAYLQALRSAVADDLGAFNADTVDAALRNYLGSSIHVVPAEEV